MTTFDKEFPMLDREEPSESLEQDLRTVLSAKGIAVPPDASKEYLERMMALLEEQESDKATNQMNLEVVRSAAHEADAFNQDSDVSGVQEHNGLRA